MAKRLLKVDPRTADPAEEAFDLDYYRSLDTAQRFRMTIERSVLLVRLANRHGTDRELAPLTKRR
ncbi:MAG TPA: hypothetical protein VJS92_10255 [Candidatus Polarisedimenticolaceae bacterium]|nr:hypothetical protein [Candidatus Polarisedimenticolaceae bacterium]